MGVYYRNWLLASRPWSFSMTFISVSVASALAALEGRFSWPLYVVTLLAMVLVHAATNLINDYYDVIHGVDSHKASTAQYRPHPLLDGEIEPRDVLRACIILYSICGAVGVALAWSRGWEILLVALAGGLASLFYTAPPFRYKYVGLGELSVFLMWGPLMMEGAYFVQTQRFSPQVLLVSLPFGALVALVLLVNNIRDMEHDGDRTIRTLPIWIGRSRGVLLAKGLLCWAYLSVVAFSAAGLLPLWSLAALATLPLGVGLLKSLSDRIPADIDARTARLDLLFGMLVLASLVVEGVF